MSSPAPSGGPSTLRVGALALLGVGALSGLIGLVTLFTGSDGNSDQDTAAPTSSATSSAGPTSGAEPGSPTNPAPGEGTAPGGPVPVPSFGGPTNGLAAPGEPGAPGAPGAPGTGGTGDGGAGTGGTGDGGAGTGGTGSGGTGSGGTGSGGTGSGGTGSGTGAAPGVAAGSGGAGARSGGGATVVRAPVRVYNNSTISGLAARAAEDFRNAGWTVEQVANYPDGIIPTSTVYYRPGTDEQAAAQSMGSQFGMRVEPRFEGLVQASPGLIVIVTNDYGTRS